MIKKQQLFAVRNTIPNFGHFEKKIKNDHFRAKKRKKIFLNFFISKMLNFQDFSKFSKILKSTVQYLSRDISNVKIGQFLRQSRKKH